MSTSIELPAASVEAAANATADRKAGHAKIWFGLAGFFAFMACVLAVDNVDRYDPNDKLDIAIGLGFWIVLFTTIAAVVLRRSRHARKVAALAARDLALRWYMQDRLVVPVDGAELPLVPFTFTISRRLRATLTAVPSARATFRAP